MDLARRCELRRERHEVVCELRADLQGRELAPPDDGEDASERALLASPELGSAVPSDELAEHLALGAGGIEGGELLLGEAGERHVEHVVRHLVVPTSGAEP